MNTNVTIVQKLTPIEAILKGNLERRSIASNAFFNLLLLGKDARGGFRNIPDEILATCPWHTGTGFAYGVRNRAPGKWIERRLNYMGEEKLLAYEVRREGRSAKDIIYLFRHGFLNGAPRIQFINAKTEKQIVRMDDIGEANGIIMRVIGRIRGFNLTASEATDFEKVGDEITRILSSDGPKIGFLRRGDDGVGDFRRDAKAGGYTDGRLSVLFEEIAR